MRLKEVAGRGLGGFSLRRGRFPDGSRYQRRMVAEDGGEVQKCVPSASLLLAKTFLHYGSSCMISSSRAHGKESASWSFLPLAITHRKVFIGTL